MPEEILARALFEAERSEPSVRAPALMRIARVQAASDPTLGRQTLQQAREEIQRIPSPDREYLLEQAHLLVAAVAPDLLEKSFPTHHPFPRFALERAGQVMIEHNQTDAAFDYVIHHVDPSTFPFGVAHTLLGNYRNDERRLAVFRAALQSGLTTLDPGFMSLVQFHWRVLPAGEATSVVREIVRVNQERPDTETSASYDQESGIEINSFRQHRLFEILHILRHLDPALAESLIATHDQLATAAKRFPFGIETLQQEAAARFNAASSDRGGNGFFMAGDATEFPHILALMEASTEADFEPLLEHGMEKYRDDTAPARPNYAPKEFWYSTDSFRGIFHAAGKRLEPAVAARLLRRIPDQDVALFARIELAAALVGLPELRGPRRFRPHPGAVPAFPDHPDPSAA